MDNKFDERAMLVYPLDERPWPMLAIPEIFIHVADGVCYLAGQDIPGFDDAVRRYVAELDKKEG